MRSMTTRAYSTPNNAEIYDSFRDRFDRFYQSEQHAFRNAVADGASVLDIGCNRAGLLTALNEVHQNIRYTGIDPDPDSLRIARTVHPDAEFVEEHFSPELFGGRRFDVLFCLSLFTHFVDWKEKLTQFSSVATTLVCDVALHHGATITDPDVSYTYYLDSGMRVPYVILNLRQFTNFCFTEKVGAQDVEVIGVSPQSTTGMAGVAPSDMLRGVAIIKKDDTGKLLFGGQKPEDNPAFLEGLDLDRYRRPHARIVWDDETFSLYD